MQQNGILAIDIGGTKVAVAAISATGEWLAQQRFMIAGAAGEQIVQDLLTVCQALVQQTALSVKGIGVSTIGVVDGDHLRLVPTIQGWDQVNLRAALKTQFTGVPIFIENDVKSATYAEVLNGTLQGTTAGMYLNLGTGVAVGLSLGDQVMRGSHGAAGEVGYLLIDQRSQASFATNHAPFEEFAGGQAIGKRLSALLGRSYTAKELWADQTNPQLQQFKQQFLDLVAFQLSNLCITWDLQVVAIGGGMEAAYEQIAPTLTAALQKNVPFPPVVKPAFYKQNASLNGIALLALHHLK